MNFGWPGCPLSVMVFAERNSSYITRKILPAFAKTHSTTTLRQHARTAERYVQAWNILYKMKERIKTLSESELDQIRKELKRGAIRIILLVVGVLFLVYVTYLAFGELKGDYRYFLITVSLCIVFAFAIHMLLTKDLRNDLQDKGKIINEYVIERKIDYEDNNPGIGGNVIRYLIVSENREFYVDKAFYESAEIGDVLEEHLTKYHKLNLGIKINKKAST